MGGRARRPSSGRRSRRGSGAIQLVDVADQALDGVTLGNAFAARLTHPGPQLGIGGELGQPFDERLDVSRRHEEAVDALADDVGHAAHARRDDGAAGGERLDHDDRRSLVRRGQDERVESLVPVRDVLLVAEEEAVADDPELARALLDVVAIRPVADEQECRVDAAFAQSSDALEHVVGALDARHPPDPADHEPIRRDPEPRARGRTGHLGLHALAELDSQADDAELLSGRNPERDEVVAHLRADRDEPGRHPRQQPLEQAKRLRLERAEVAVEDMAVKRVDDDRRPGGACEERRHTPHRARLRRMRVQDLRPLLADQAGKSKHRKRVPDRRDLPRQRVELDDLDAELLRHIRHRALAARERAGDERRLVASLREPRREVGDVERRAAHVQARDHAQDADRLSRQGIRQFGGARPRSRRSAPSRGSPVRPRCRRRSRAGRPRGVARSAARPACRAAR